MHARDDQESRVDYLYDAFISYSRDDEPFVQELEADLERYRPPRGIGEAKRLKVFRDVQDLVGNELSQAIHDAIAHSRYLIVVCSPHSHRSVYVGGEIDLFAQLHGRERVIAILIAGRPNHEVAPADPAQDRAFPEALCRLFAEPLAADFRPHPTDTRWRRRMRQREARFFLLASLLGVEKERLLQRQYRRTVQGWALAAVLFLGLAVAFAVIALRANRAQVAAEEQRSVAEQQRSVAEQQRLRASSRLLSIQARSLIPTEVDLALLLSAEAHHTYGHSESLGSLVAALQHDPRLVTFLRGHESDVRSLAFSANGSLLASGGEDNTVRVWDTTTWQPRTPPLRGHEAAVQALMFTDDGSELISVGDDGIRRWNVASGQQVSAPMTLGEDLETTGIQGTAFSPNRKQLAVQGAFSVTLFDLGAWTLIGNVAASDALQGVAYTPDAKRLVVLNRDGGVQLWDTSTWRRVGKTSSLTSPPIRLACSPDGKRWATGITWIDLLDAKTRQPLAFPQHAHDGNILALVFSPDGKLLASGATDAIVRLWDVESWQPFGAPMQQQDMVDTIVWSPDSKLVAVGNDRSITIWQVEARSRLAQTLEGTEHPYSVAVSPDGTRLWAGLADGRVQLWDLERRTLESAAEVLPDDFDVVSNVKVSPQGSQVALAGMDVVALWDLATQRLRGQVRHSDGPAPAHVPGVAFNPDGTKLATGGIDAVVRLWNADTLQSLGELRGNDAPVLNLAFSANGTRLASANGDGTVRVWDAERLQPVGAPLQVSHDAVVAAAFVDAAGERLRCVDREGNVGVWNVATGKSEEQSRLAGRGMVLGASFDVAGGRWMAALRMVPERAADASIDLWDMAAQEAVDEPLSADLDQSFPAWGNLAFSRDGRLLVSGNAGDNILLWNVDPAAWEAQACRIANRNLRRDEWDRYVGADLPYHCTCPGVPCADGPPE